MIEAVVNVSEGRRREVVEEIAAQAGSFLLDVHSDPHHNRSVLTLFGDAHGVVEAALKVARTTVSLVDLSRHEGVHPRLGAVDVVPFVPYGSPLDEALVARRRFAEELAGDAVPCFYYGPERSLPEVRKRAWTTLWPDVGPREPHPSAGATCVGVRGVLVAYNLVVDGSPELARRVAAQVRGPALRALGLRLGEAAQVSINLIDPDRLGPAEAFDAVGALVPVLAAELVGLVPERVRARIPSTRWDALGLGGAVTIEERAEARRER